MAESWHIRSRSRHCALTEKPFTEGDSIVTALFPDPESSGYLRKDFAEEAWKHRPADAEPPFSHWRGTFTPVVHEEKNNPMDKEDPEALLRRLVEDDEDHTENIRYILAVMLERKKLLRETDSQRTASGILRVYEHRKTGEAFLIRDPDIPLSEVERVQDEVVLLLNSGGQIPDSSAPAGETEKTEETESAEPDGTSPGA